ncbi:MAG: HEAT repeat domain-containing protein [Phycisphaerae bacterium]|nr:HEAT repeat domain-containing protein [Phycisphaerae bacterium]MDD5381586.1 HEAT repeat domain-containing protein [Phycisphaerae bacterium]
MKTSRYILIAAAGLLIGLSNAALARPKVKVDINIGGRPGFRGGHRGDFRFGHRPRYFAPVRGWRGSHPRRQTIVIGGSWYDSRPNYYVVAPPRVVERVPVVIERQTVVYSNTPQVVQPQQFDESTLQMNMDLQYKKSELLKQLQAPNKELRRGAIKELAGFSFDDNVRAALENILLSDPDPELRAEAADAFGTVKNANARAALEKARVEDPSADVRRAADDAIRSISGN